jgi:hypothetical protein
MDTKGMRFNDLRDALSSGAPLVWEVEDGPQ